VKSVPSEYPQSKSADQAFALIDADPSTGATLSQALPGLDVQFGVTNPHRYDIYGLPVAEPPQPPSATLVRCRTNKVSLALIDDIGPGSVFHTEDRGCLVLSGGASGGPWINTRTGRVEAVSFQQETTQDGKVLAADGLPLLGPAEAAYHALP
jgi:hypothetical protein